MPSDSVVFDRAAEYYESAAKKDPDELAYFLALKGGTGREEAFRERFAVMALQRNLKALGTFGYQTTARENPATPSYGEWPLISRRSMGA